jgi:beta-glucosidase
VRLLQDTLRGAWQFHGYVTSDCWAITDIAVGHKFTPDLENNPAGRLPVTFYASTSQLPAFDDYAMQGRTYRYFQGKPLFGFGYGLSHTSFVYSHLKLSSPTLNAGDTLTADAEVKNTGARDGDEVAELYLLPP